MPGLTFDSSDSIYPKKKCLVCKNEIKKPKWQVVNKIYNTVVGYLCEICRYQSESPK